MTGVVRRHASLESFPRSAEPWLDQWEADLNRLHRRLGYGPVAEERLAALLRAGIGLWDVIGECD